MRNQWTRSLLHVFALFGMLASTQSHADLQFLIHPYKPASQLIVAYTPFADYLGKKIGQKITIRISKDYKTHVEAIVKNKFDIAYMGPGPYVEMAEISHDKQLLARQFINGSPTFQGKIIVRKDSPFRSLADLRGKRFAFVEPLSTMGYLAPASMLLEQGVTPAQLGRSRFLRDHVNVALSVLAGDDDAGAVKEDVFYDYEERGLRALATTPPISDHVFLASSTVSPATVEALRDSMLGLAAAQGGKEILAQMTHGLTALIPASDSDYESMRTIMRRLKAAGLAH